MTDYGIKVSKTGKDISSTDPRDISMSSKYSMLKHHSDTSVDVTYHPGDTDQHTDITHNLGYTPAFIAYVKDVNGNFRFIPSAYQGSGVTNYPYAYSDSTKVRCGYAFLTGAYSQYENTPSDWWNTFDNDNSHFSVGRQNPTGTFNGALRFVDVTISQGETITTATLYVGVETKGTDTTSLQFKCWGINEDNTASFGNPMGRSKTVAVITTSTSMSIATPFQFGIDVTSQVQEILNRGGWASGNAMGFIIEDNGSPNDCWARDDPGGSVDSELVITYGSNVTLTFRCIVFKDKLL